VTAEKIKQGIEKADTCNNKHERTETTEMVRCNENGALHRKVRCTCALPWCVAPVHCPCALRNRTGLAENIEG